MRLWRMNFYQIWSGLGPIISGSWHVNHFLLNWFIFHYSMLLQVSKILCVMARLLFFLISIIKQEVQWMCLWSFLWAFKCKPLLLKINFYPVSSLLLLHNQQYWNENSPFEIHFMKVSNQKSFGPLSGGKELRAIWNKFILELYVPTGELFTYSLICACPCLYFQCFFGLVWVESCPLDCVHSQGWFRRILKLILLLFSLGTFC